MLLSAVNFAICKAAKLMDNADLGESNFSNYRSVSIINRTLAKDAAIWPPISLGEIAGERASGLWTYFEDKILNLKS